MAKLLVTVDTEEEGLWGGEYRREGNTVENIRHITRFQQVCDRFDIRPTYLVDTPVAESDEAVDILKAFQEEDRAEIGSHLHPWCAPPFEEEINDRNSFLCNLPEPLQREKMIRLTDLIESRFGRRPTSFRSGRYGMDAVGTRILEELGYLIDSSVICFTNYESREGPNFSSAPFLPYRVDKKDILTSQSNGGILEAPVSVGYNRANFFLADCVWRGAAASWLRPFHLVGILDRLGLVRHIKFSPEQSDGPRMNRLVDSYQKNHAPCMVLMLHSSSLSLGHSPYAQDDRGLERLYRILETTLEYCRSRHGMVGQTLSEFARSFSNS